MPFFSTLKFFNYEISIFFACPYTLYTNYHFGMMLYFVNGITKFQIFSLTPPPPPQLSGIWDMLFQTITTLPISDFNLKYRPPPPPPPQLGS